MKANKNAIVIFLVLIFLAIAFMYYYTHQDCFKPIEQEVFLEGVNDLQSCNVDSDCLAVRKACCGCNSGGEDVAINTKYVDQFNESKSSICGMSFCFQSMSDDPSCNSNAVCQSGSCRLIHNCKWF